MADSNDAPVAELRHDAKWYDDHNRAREKRRSTRAADVIEQQRETIARLEREREEARGLVAIKVATLNSTTELWNKQRATIAGQAKALDAVRALVPETSQQWLQYPTGGGRDVEVQTLDYADVQAALALAPASEERAEAVDADERCGRCWVRRSIHGDGHAFVSDAVDADERCAFVFPYGATCGAAHEHACEGHAFVRKEKR